jgi:hypothetical protein
MEQRLLDGLLRTLQRDFCEEIETQHRIPPGPVRRAVEVLEERPDEPWTTTTLAAGFRWHAWVSPAMYLRSVRLGKVRDDLATAAPGLTVAESAIS